MAEGGSDGEEPEDEVRTWTYEAANQIVPDVLRLTRRARDRYDPARERRDAQPAGTGERVDAEHDMRRFLSRWVRDMEALGVRVCGLWRVEFPTEEGCFPWQWPEESLRSFRGEDEESSIH